MAWTESQTKTLCILWKQGISTTEIAQVLGVTKNAVCGKRYRLGLPERGSPIKRIRSLKKNRRIESKNKCKSCMWPIGHSYESGFHLCGEPADAQNGVWCQRHYRSAYKFPVKLPKLPMLKSAKG